MSDTERRPTNWGTVLGVVVALATHLVTTVWWASGVASNIVTQEEDIDILDRRLSSVEQTVQTVTGATIRTETELAGVGRDISRMEAAIQANSALLRELLREISK